MYSVKKEGVILDITKLEFENESVLNPAVIQEGETVHIFYRAVRKGNHSTIGYCKLNGPTEVVHRNKAPLLSPHFEYESRGIEDPRIVKIDGLEEHHVNLNQGQSQLSVICWRGLQWTSMIKYKPIG